MDILLALLCVVAVAPGEPAQDPLGKGFLGITVPVAGMTVSSVQAGTPADLAGFLPGDELVRVGDLTPSDFSQVTAHLKSFRPGSRVTFVVTRGGEKKTLTAKLMARPAAADFQFEAFPP